MRSTREERKPVTRDDYDDNNNNTIITIIIALYGLGLVTCSSSELLLKL
jgi:hypothetical protein